MYVHIEWRERERDVHLSIQVFDEWKSVEDCSEMLIDDPCVTSIDVEMSDREILFVEEKEEFRCDLEESFRRHVDVSVQIIIILVNGEMDLLMKSVFILLGEKKCSIQSLVDRSVLRDGIPVIVCEGTGGCADLVGECILLFRSSPCLSSIVEDRFKEKCPSMSNLQNLSRRENCFSSIDWKIHRSHHELGSVIVVALLNGNSSRKRREGKSLFL